MKNKFLLIGIAALALAGCNDELNLVGPSIQPESDQLIVYADTFELKAKTFEVESIYSRTTRALLGNFEEDLFGTLKADYMCQFYCPEDFKFKHTPINEKIDSSEFRIIYYSALGDSLAPMNAQLFQLNKTLPKEFYTNVDPNKYYSKSDLLGEKMYSSYDMSLSDSIKAIIAANYENYPRSIIMDLPNQFGQNFYEQSKDNPENFKDQEAFNEYFKGVYVTTNIGKGNILNVSESSITFFYKYMHEGKTSTDKDTSYVKQAYEKFIVTPEVYQLNQIKNDINIKDLESQKDSLAFLKTPAGVFTEVEIPLKEMAEKVKGRILSNLSFSLTVLPPVDWEYSMTFMTPNYALLLPKDSINTFFVEKSVENNKTSFLSQSYYDLLNKTDRREYNFGNISALLRTAIEESEKSGKPVENIKMAIVPVDRIATESQYGGIYTTRLDNYLSPSAVKLNIKPEALKIEIISSEYK